MPPSLRRMHYEPPRGLGERRDGFRYGFLLLCVPCELKIERLGQVACSFVGCQMMDSAPKVEHVPGGSAGRMETLEDVLAQVNGKGASTSALRAVDGTGPTTLGTLASQAIEVAQMTQHAFHGDLATDVREVDGAIAIA